MLENIFSDTAALWSIVFIVTLGLIAVGAAWKAFKQLMHSIEELEAKLPELLSRGSAPPGGPAGSLWNEFQKRLVLTSSAPQPPILLREPVEPALEDRGRTLLRSSDWGRAAYGIGENLTGIALIITFILLGSVLGGPVYEALRGTTETAQGEQLSAAIRQMGAKFFVSATGVLLAIFFQAVSGRWEDKIAERARRLWYKHAERFETLEALRVRTAAERFEELRKVRQELRETRESWSQQFQRLESIEVSVQGIGNEVSSHFGSLMKQQVADVICDKIAVLEESARTVAEQMSIAVSTFVAKELANVRSSLEELQRTVASQSQSDLERLMIQLRDAVSGGFHSQSQDMARQMGQFASLLPRLEEQFALMSTSLGQNARSWGEQNQRAVQELGEKVTALVTQFDQVRSGMQESVERLLQTTAQSSARLQSDTQMQIDTVAQKMAELRQAAAQDASSFEERTRAFTAAMSNAQNELAPLLKLLRQTTGEFAAVLKSTSETHEKSSTVIARFDEAARRLTEGTQSLGTMLQQRTGVLEREEKLLAAQRSAVDSLEGVMREVLTAYEDSLKNQAGMLSEQWKRLATDVRNIVERSSQELTENVEDLNTTVEDLKKSLQVLPRARS
jgi:hypothetical protein